LGVMVMSKSKAISDLDVLLRAMEPVLHEGVYVYAVVPLNADLTSVAPLATFREAEGMTVIGSSGAKSRSPDHIPRRMDHAHGALRSASSWPYSSFFSRTE
jgi:ACT domain